MNETFRQCNSDGCAKVGNKYVSIELQNDEVIQWVKNEKIKMKQG